MSGGGGEGGCAVLVRISIKFGDGQFGTVPGRPPFCLSVAGVEVWMSRARVFVCRADNQAKGSASPPPPPPPPHFLIFFEGFRVLIKTPAGGSERHSGNQTNDLRI